MNRSHTSGDPVPAISEAEAEGEIAHLYEDIRATLGVPVVNLIWRHLAIMPGALGWAWTSVKPLYASGLIASEGAKLRGDLSLPSLPPVPADVTASLGLDEKDMAHIRVVLAAYDTTNAMNMVALTALLAKVSGATGNGEAALPRVTKAPEAPGAALPKLLTFDEMTPATGELVRRLNLIAEPHDGTVVASMYRHLAHWPAMLALVWGQLAHLDAEGTLARLVAEGQAKAQERAAGLIGGLGEAGDLDGSARTELEAAITLFTTGPIAKMMTLCGILRQAWGP